MSNSLAVIETVLDLDHEVMVGTGLIGKTQEEIEVPLQNAAVVAADVIVHIVPNGPFGLIIYHHVAARNSVCDVDVVDVRRDWRFLSLMVGQN